MNFESIPNILKLVTTPLALAGLAVLLLSLRGGLVTKYGFILALVLGVIAFVAYLFQTVMPYLFPQRAEVWTVTGYISTDEPLEHSDQLVISSNPAMGEYEPKDNSFIAKVVVPRRTDGTLAFPKLYIGRDPIGQYEARTIHLDTHETLSDTDKPYPVEPTAHPQELRIGTPVELKRAPEYKGTGAPPAPLSSASPDRTIAEGGQ